MLWNKFCTNLFHPSSSLLLLLVLLDEVIDGQYAAKMGLNSTLSMTNSRVNNIIAPIFLKCHCDDMTLCFFYQIWMYTKFIRMQIKKQKILKKKIQMLPRLLLEYNLNIKHLIWPLALIRARRSHNMGQNREGWLSIRFWIYFIGMCHNANESHLFRTFIASIHIHTSIFYIYISMVDGHIQYRN